MASATLSANRYPLYSTTFTIHRLSPFHTGDSVLDNPTLQQYASQFRDILAGDVLRGVRVGLAADDDILARVGALKGVKWQLLMDEEFHHSNVDDSGMDDTTNLESSPVGMTVDIQYERAGYTAIFLQDSKHGDEAEQIQNPGFAQFPLLLTRMPGSLRETFLDFLATTFDTRASVMRLSSVFLTNALEKYLVSITTSDGESLAALPASRSLKTIIKDLVITLALNVQGGDASLKTIDITIVRDDLWRMMARGRKIQQVQRNQAVSEDHHFMAALTHYVDGHLGLDVSNPSVSISKVACAAFVLGGEGKVKLFPPVAADDDDLQGRATWALVACLVQLARGSGMKIVSLS